MRADLLFTYKLVFGLIDASLHDFLYHASTKLDDVTTINCTSQPAKQTLDGCIVWNAHNTVLGEEALLIYIVPVCYVKTGRYGKT